MTASLDGFEVREIGRERTEDMLRILAASPVETRGLSVWFDRAPDVFRIPELYSDRVICAGFVKNGDLAGFAMLQYRTLCVNGKAETVMYLGSVHAKPEVRGRGFTYRVSDFLFRQNDGEATLGYAVVMKGNRSAEKFIGSHRPEYPHIPPSRAVSTLRVKNILIKGPKKRSRGFQVRPGCQTDVSAVAGLLREEFTPRLFGPVISESECLARLAARPGHSPASSYVVERAGRVVGTCAALDMTLLKRTRIVSYGPRLALVKSLYASASRLFGFPRPPARGEAFREVTITDCAVLDRDPEILEALLIAVYNEARFKNTNIMNFGSCADDPLFEAADVFLGPSTLSTIVMFAPDPAFLAEGRVDICLPYIDLGML